MRASGEIPHFQKTRSQSIGIFICFIISDLTKIIPESDPGDLYDRGMNTLLAVFNAFPAILQSVQAVETAIPMSKSGQQKMNLVLGAAATAWEVGQVGEQINQSNWLAGVQAMTNVAVAGLNASGVFHTTQSQVATPATVVQGTAPQSVPAAPVSSN